MRELAVFAKYWQPGDVKTRLATETGEAPAAQIHRALLETVLARLAPCADRSVLAFTPPDHRGDFERLAAGRWQVVAQADGNLGARLEHYFREALQAGAERVVVVGADSPNLPVAVIDEAFERLAASPVVLGPTEDGGYYLVGVRDRVPPIFRDVPWGTHRVWPETTARLASAETPFATLPIWYDVDEHDDLARLRRDLAGCQGAEAALDALQAKLDEILGEEKP